jgi:hypothetical protein
MFAEYSDLAEKKLSLNADDLVELRKQELLDLGDDKD